MISPLPTTSVRSSVRRSKKPTIIRNGNVSAKIYTIRNQVNGATYEQYVLAYSMGNKRVTRKFADMELAKTEADLVVTKMANGETDALKLTSLDRAAYVEAINLLEPHNIRLNTAVADYVDGIKRLPSGTTLRDAISFFLQRGPAGITQKTVQQIVDEMVAAKQNARRSFVHVKDLAGRLNRFAGAFQMDLGQVTGPMVQDYLNGLGDVSGRTQINHLRHIISLFNFAIKRRYLPKDAKDELEVVEWPDEEEGEIKIFSPHELRLFLANARPEMIPWLTIAAFAGIRSAELQRLSWSEIHIDERFIEIKAAKAKTASRRLAPITDNLAAWLTPYAQQSGQVAPFANMAKQIVRLIEDVNAALKKNAEADGADPHSVQKVGWKRNGLRHSFVSYRLAIIKDVAQIALEAGNSPTMVFKNYRQVVTEAEAQRWYSIVPEAKANIVPFVAAAAP